MAKSSKFFSKFTMSVDPVHEVSDKDKDKPQDKEKHQDKDKHQDKHQQRCHPSWGLFHLLLLQCR